MNTATAENKIVYTASAHNFSKIPGSPIAYWVSRKLIVAFDKGKKLDTISSPRQGIIPGNVEVFVKLWFEVPLHKIGFNHNSYLDICKYKKKWYPYNKGGAYRKWYGNIEYVLNMENNGYAIKNSKLNNNYRLREPELYFQEAITWSKISSGTFSMRKMERGNLFDIAGCCVFELGDLLDYVLGFVNSIISSEILKFLSPTLNYEVDHIKKLPVIIHEQYKEDIQKIVENNILLSKSDWDSFETSWDFKKHPLI